MVNSQAQPGLTGLGKLMVFLVVAGLIGAGLFLMKKKEPAKTDGAGGTAQPQPPVRGNGGGGGPGPDELAAESPEGMAETATEIPKLVPAAAYQPKDNTVEVELSEYAGYAGLIAANGGLAPNESSFFFRKYGFKVKITLSEEESWNALNSGKLAASATTVDVLAVYGRQFEVVVPAQISFSRGADGIVVTSDVKKINALKGRTLAAVQFTEADFFIRYLAQEAGIGVRMLSGLQEQPDPERINLVYSEDGSAGSVFLAELNAGRKRLSGFVAWAPETTDTVQQSGAKAHMLATNRNLLIIADILVVNKGFAQQNPKMVKGLTHGLLEGNRLVRDSQDAHLDVVAGAFKWTREQAKAEFAKVHLSNLPESQAFFSGAIDMAGSFNGIYQSAVYSYGAELIKNPVDGERFLDTSHLKGLQDAGEYKDQKISIAPIRSGTPSAVEGDPLLSKDIRFFFEPNSSKLDMAREENLKNLDALKNLLTVSPGSTILLRGHVDNAMIEEFRKQGGETFVRQMALKAMELSKNRAAEIRKLLVEKNGADGARLETVGRGWEEPAGPDSEKNRRVEAQWFTVE